MRTRVLTSLAVVAAALLAPSAALAVTAPDISSPASGSLSTAAPVALTWGDVSDETGYRVFRADANCVSNPVELTLFGGDLPADSTTFSDLSPAEGVRCYFVQAFDLSDLANSSGVLVTFDSQPPTGSLTVPGGGNPLSTLPGAIVLTATASDAGAGVDGVTFFASPHGDNDWTSLGTDSGAPYSTAWSPADDTYDLYAHITDNAGRSFDTAVVDSVRIDSTAPNATLTAPPAIMHGNSNTLTATASDNGGGTGVSSVVFQRFNGSAWVTFLTSADTSSPYSAAWNTTGVTGSFTVRALVTDGANNATPSSSASVTVDTTNPTGAVTPPGGGIFLHGTATLNATASDVGTSVSSVAFEYFNGTTWVPIGLPDSSSPYSVSWNTVGLNGGINVHVVVTDAATNTSTSSPVTVQVDNTVPVASLSAPLAGALLRGTVVANATATDVGGSGVTSVAFQWAVAGGSTWTTFATDNTDNAPAYSGSLITTGLTDGRYDIRAVASDFATNQGISTPVVANVLVDNTAPSQPGTPTGFTPVQSAPSFTFGASTDPLVPAVTGVASGLNHYNVSRDGGAPVATTATTFVDSSALADGLHSYTVVAVDNAGNTSAPSGTFTVFLDSAAASSPTSVAAAATPTNQRPQISWVAPTAPGFTIDHYDIFRVGTGPRVGVVDDALTTFADNSVSLPDNTYAYVVVAVSDTAFSGVASGAAGVVYDTTVPSGPASVAAGAALDGSVNVSWAASSDGSGSGVARYVVRRSSSSIPPATVADGDATCQTTATSCVDASALNGKLYSYAVFAVDAAGNTSVAGASQPVTARDQAPPNAPQNLAAKPGNASVDLSWTPAAVDSDVAGYVLVAKQGTQAPTSETDGLRVCTAIIGSSSSCAAGGLTNGAAYTFGLFALDEALNRSQPAVVSAAPNGKVTDVKAPGAVSKLRVKIVGKKVTLTWKNPADRDFDHVVITSSTRKPSERKASTRVYSGKGTKAATKLPAGQSRWFLVIAYDAVGNASAPASVRAIVAPVSPFGPAPHAKVKGKVRLSWPVVKRARYYNVQIYAGKKRIAIVWPARHKLVVPRAKLHKGVKYTWYVWPGLGAKAKAHYGKLIGKNVFTFAG